MPGDFRDSSNSRFVQLACPELSNHGEGMLFSSQLRQCSRQRNSEHDVVRFLIDGFLNNQLDFRKRNTDSPHADTQVEPGLCIIRILPHGFAAGQPGHLTLLNSGSMDEKLRQRHIRKPLPPLKRDHVHLAHIYWGFHKYSFLQQTP